jgi:hypothetical protein
MDLMDTPDGGSAKRYFEKYPENAACQHNGRIQGFIAIKCLCCGRWTMDGVTWHECLNPEVRGGA